MEKGIEKGKIEGLAEGMVAGETKGRTEIAKQLKSLGIPIEQIAIATNLSVAEIEKM